MARVFVHQIYYDDVTQQKLQPAFIPLDNTRNERPDWFEFWVILDFLRSHPLADDAWYGFVSPRFGEKTGLESAAVVRTLHELGDRANVALFTSAWDELAYFLNPWEQGEAWHPGLLAASQEFFALAGRAADLQGMVTDSYTSVYANYVVAKRPFWTEWRDLAEKFFAYAESGSLAGAVHTRYARGTQAPMKTFIQERFATLILASGQFDVFAADQSLTGPISTWVFPSDGLTRRLLQACDLLKTRYRATGDAAYLDMYWKLRREVPYGGPAPK